MISYKYKLYSNKYNRFLEAMLREAAFVWNHALALQKRYYSLFHKFISANALQKHFAKRINRNLLHSQSVQEILQRLDLAYKRFFKHIAKRPPKFKRAKDFSSFVFKQGGFSLNGNVFTINKLHKSFKFSYSRPYEGNIKVVRIKRNHLNEFFIYITTDATASVYTKTHDGACVGIDFGMKKYLTLSDGNEFENPLFLKKSLKKLANVQKKLSRKKKGSNHMELARKQVVRLHEKIANQRDDYQWKLAHALCQSYDTIFIEDLNLQGMVKLWGRKVNDLAHGSFIEKLQQVAMKYGIRVHKINRYFPSSKLCDCGWKNETLTLRDREWVCPRCGQVHDRDKHASEMILRRGIYELESGSKTDKVCLHSFSSHVNIQEFHEL